MVLDPDSQYESEFGPATYRIWFRSALLNLIGEGESFSGKRPCGNSDWMQYMASDLIQRGLVEGEVDDNAEVISVNWDQVEVVLRNMVGRLL